LLKEARQNDQKKQVVPIDKMLNKYYKIRGYDPNGVPSLRTLHELGIPVAS
jgi:aldehyde:ferredoxin oxidoreductase